MYLKYTCSVWVRAIQFSIPVTLEITSLGLFFLQKPWMDRDPSFFRQGLILYGLVLTCQGLLVVFRGNRERFVTMLFFFCASFVLGYPMGEEIFCELLLYAAGLFNLGIYFPGRIGFAVGIGGVLCSVYLQQEAIVWGNRMPAPRSGSILFMAIGELVILLLSQGLSRVLQELKNAKHQLDQLTSMVRNLTKANVRFQEYADTIVETSLQEERRRISRELHDTVGYSLTNIRMLMEEAIGQYDGNSEDFIQLLVDARDQAMTAMEEARSAFKALRSMESEQTPVNLRSILRLAKAFSDATHLQVSVDFSNARLSYGTNIDHFLYRFVQEGMTNALRHGRATRLEIYLHEEGGRLQVSMIDNGVGGKVIQEGIGLGGMRERIRELGGELSVGNGNHGFSLYVTLPLKGDFDVG